MEPMRIDVLGDAHMQQKFDDAALPQGLGGGLPTPAPALAKAQAGLRGAAPPGYPQAPPPAPVAPENWASPDDGAPSFPYGGGGLAPGMFPPGGMQSPFPQMPFQMWPHQGFMPQMPGYPHMPYMDPQSMKGAMMPPYGMPMQPYQLGAPQEGARGGEKGGSQSKSGGKKARSTERRKRGRAKGRERTPPPETDDTANLSPALRKVTVEGTKCKLPLDEVKDHVIEFAKHQHGSKFLQAKLDDSQISESDKRMILEEAQTDVANLAKHTYGNHFIQKLFEKVSMEQRKELANELKGQILALTMDTNGCRVIQKALHVVSRNSQLMLADELKMNVHDCIHHMHGNHVIQKCIEQMPPDSVTFIINAVEEKVYETASHMYGCRVIQRLLEHCQSQQLSKIQQEIVESAQKLSQDAYGNYVVQHVLEHGRKEDKQKIIVQVTNNLLEFSKNKHSSNVVEKCFEFATCGEHSAQLVEERAALVDAVLGAPGDPLAPISQMMSDKFGNYIVQRVIEYCKGPEKDRLKHQIITQEAALKSNPQGKHILTAVENAFGKELFVATGAP